MNKSTKGFTLIELMVVIGILGLLSTVVLGVLGGQRNKASDASIKANLAQIRTQANLVFDLLNGSYGPQTFTSDCGAIGVVGPPATNVFNGEKSQAQIDDAISKNGGILAKCTSAANYYVIAVPLKSNSLNALCMDHTGVITQITFLNFAASETTCVAAGNP